VTQIIFSDIADQRVSDVIGTSRMTFRFRYNPSCEFWSVDLSIDGIEKLLARRLVHGFNEFYFDFFDGAIICDGAEPTRENVANGNCQVYVISREELDDAALAP